MRKKDTTSAIVLLCAGGFMAWQSVRLSIGSLRKPGPGFFPFSLSLSLVAAALMILAHGLKGTPEIPEQGLKKYRVAIALAAIFAYAFVLETAGYLVATFFLIWLLLKLMAKKAWWFAPGVACLISLVSYVLFKMWLKVLLPAGLLTF
jgi:putative tricarboxylic transport membrane protein